MNDIGKKNIGMKVTLSLILLWAGLFNTSTAQTDTIKGTNIRPLSVSGSIGLSANAYAASGIQNRRAPSSLQTTANLNFSLFGFSSGLSLLFSTDQTGLRQNMNNLSFDATWNWITVQAGDVSPDFSEYGINGATIRGGYVEMKPGRWQLMFSGGRSKRKVELSSKTGFREPAFERWSMAGKIGYESTNKSYFFISTHYSLDKANSLNNPGSISPQENLTITPDARVSLFGGALSLASQLTVSAFTRDVNTPEIPLEAIGLPSFLSGIMKAHTSSRVNYAGQASASLLLNQFGLELEYERIQPGFTSLGVSRIRDDQEKIRIAPSVHLLNSKLILESNVELNRDNLLDSRIQTQRNTTAGTNVQYQLTDFVSINASYNLLVNDFSSNGTSDTSFTQGISIGQRNISHTLMVQPSVTFQKNERTHNISVSGSYFTLANNFKRGGSSVPEGMDSDTYSSSVTYSLTLPTGLSINTMTNVLVNNSNFSRSTTLGGNVGASLSFFDRKLALSANGGINQNSSKSNLQGMDQQDVTTETRQLIFNLTTNFRLTSRDTFSLTLRNRNNNSIQGRGNTFTELEGSFKYQHRF